MLRKAGAHLDGDRAVLGPPVATIHSEIKPGQAGSWLEHPASSARPRAKAMEILILLRLRPYGWAHWIKSHLGL